MEKNRPTLSLLYHVAFLYLGLAYGADKRLHPEERRTIAAMLRQQFPEVNPALIDHVIREAMLSYLNAMGAAELQQAIDVLALMLSAEMKRGMLDDLAAIADSDRIVLSLERGFIERIEQSWRTRPSGELQI